MERRRYGPRPSGDGLPPRSGKPRGLQLFNVTT